MTNEQINSLWWTHRNKNGVINKEEFIKAIKETIFLINLEIQNAVDEDLKKFLQGFAYEEPKTKR